jgi:hypothetical protein
LQSAWAQPVLRAVTVTAVSEPHTSVSPEVWASLLESDLVLNGADATTNEAMGNYQRVSWKQDGSAAAQVAALSPEVVFVLSNYVVSGPDLNVATDGTVIAAIEAAWTGRARPTYLVPSKLDWSMDASVLDVVGQDPSLAGRIWAANIVSQEPDPTIEAAFLERFQEFTGHSPALGGQWSTDANAYDAAYLLGGAAASLDDDDEPTGAAILQRLRRMNPPGAPLAVGPTDFPQLVAALRDEGTDVDLQGASAPLSHPPDVEVWCVSAGPPPSYAPAGLTYRGITDEWIGELKSCL